jgi:4-hydroxyacetophenone monooxygenase
LISQEIALKVQKASEMTDEAVESADASTLLMVLVQFTRDVDILERARPYIKGPFEFNEEMPEALRREIRDKLKVVLADYAAGRRPLPSVPEPSLLEHMMSVAAGQPVRPEYVEFVGREMTFEDVVAVEKRTWDAIPAERRAATKVVVIGAGISGILAAIKLKQAGVSFSVYEKNPSVGGTWFENNYPGCGVDTPNHFYSYSFEPKYDWSLYYSKRDEILTYLRYCAEKYGILGDVVFDTTVEGATYDDKKMEWSTTIVSQDGKREQVRSDFVIFATGQLNWPSIPQIPGLDQFSGTCVHTARWTPDIDVSGKRVAMIGSGASGVQVAPSIADKVSQLTIFQRQAHWVLPRPNNSKAVRDGKKLALKEIPFYAMWYRFQLFWGSGDGIHATLRIDPSWENQTGSVNAKNHSTRQLMEDTIKKEIGSRLDLLEKVTPKYPPYGRRVLREDRWFPMLKRENVELVMTDIEAVTKDGIRTTDQKFYPLDAIILATGFRGNELLSNFKIQGKGGANLRQVWGKDDARAYLGITVPSFPNMFIMYGPNTNLAHGGSGIFLSECQMTLIMQAMHFVIENNYHSVECRQEVHDEYAKRVDEEHEHMVWTHKDVNSWYKNSRGRVWSLTPFRMIDYWQSTLKFNASDYLVG